MHGGAGGPGGNEDPARARSVAASCAFIASTDISSTNRDKLVEGVLAGERVPLPKPLEGAPAR